MNDTRSILSVSDALRELRAVDPQAVTEIAETRAWLRGIPSLLDELAGECCTLLAYGRARLRLKDSNVNAGCC